MKLLLDTHCLLWLLTDSERLDAGARRAIDDAESVSFSDASLWELGLKWRKGKIGLQPRQIAEQALRNGLRPMAIDREALFVSSELKHAHGDPFDRLLYAQARVSGMKLLCIDRALGELAATIVTGGGRMSAPGRPKGEYRSARHEGTPVSAPGRSQVLIPKRAAWRVVQ